MKETEKCYNVVSYLLTLQFLGYRPTDSQQNDSKERPTVM